MKINLNKFYFKKFGTDKKSSFPYWYYHWKAFNLVALSLSCWKFKFLFHDIEKPWLKLIWPYSKVQKWHRVHNSHHLDYYKGLDHVDWLALVIDNECSRYTKVNAPMSAREYYNYSITVRYEKGKTTEEQKKAMEKNLPPILEKLGL